MIHGVIFCKHSVSLPDGWREEKHILHIKKNIFQTTFKKKQKQIHSLKILMFAFTAVFATTLTHLCVCVHVFVFVYVCACSGKKKTALSKAAII